MRSDVHHAPAYFVLGEQLSQEDGPAQLVSVPGVSSPPVETPAYQWRTSQPNRYPGVNGVESYDEGLAVGHRWYDATGHRPLVPFGYGLSYESFRVSGVHAFYTPRRGDAFVLARDTNTSSRTGPATVELFLQSPPAAQEPPKQLKGYANVTLAPGKSRFVLFRLQSSDLAYFNATSDQWTVAPGRYTALVGTSSTELDHAARFEVGRHRR